MVFAKILCGGKDSSHEIVRYNAFDILSYDVRT